MTDSATTRKRMRKQSLGSNTNTWGDTKLNEVLDVIDQIIDGYETIALTTDITLTTTNYTTADQAKYRIIRFTGTGAYTITFPTVEGWMYVKNDCTGALTVKCSGGTGIAIAASRACLVRGDGTDLFSMVSNYQPTSITLTNSGDIPTYGQVQTIVANAALPASAGTQLNSGTDTTAGYLAQKLTVSGGASLSTVNGGANETRNIAIAPHGLTLSTAKTSGFTAVAGNLYPCDVSSANFTMTLPATASLGDTVGFLIYGLNGLTFGTNGLKINGSTSNITLYDEQTGFITYSGASRGWV